MLPLAIGMRVAISAVHLDRSPEMSLLKGRIGRVHSWLWEDNDRRPSVVYVKFDGAEWQLDGTDEVGIYPIRPIKRSWYLDARRKPRVLEIRRTQIPLTPAYAMTAHSSQGKTLPAVLLDLCVEKRVDVTFGAVAASRVRSRDDCLILRPFDRWLFDRGPPEGPGLLLRTLRGEDVDWNVYLEACTPCAECKSCDRRLSLDNFDLENWERVRANRGPPLCLECKWKNPMVVKRKLDGGAVKFVCSSCKVSKVEDAYPRAQLRHVVGPVGSAVVLESDVDDRVVLCIGCCKNLVSLTCGCCGMEKDVNAFESTMVTFPLGYGVCQECQHAARKKHKIPGWFSCRTCGVHYYWMAGALPRSTSVDTRYRRCLNCASGWMREKDVKTCRNKSCKRKFSEPVNVSGKRFRTCPDCRRG